MGQLNLPSNLNKPTERMPPPQQKMDSTDANQESKFSIKEKIKLFSLISLAIAIPVIGTVSLSRYFYKKELETFKNSSETQIESLKTQINVLTNPSIKQLHEYENIFKKNLLEIIAQKELLEKDTVYQELIKKTKELDKQIIICNVHLQNIEIVKQNKYKEVEILIEKLNKENIK